MSKVIVDLDKLKAEKPNVGKFIEAWAKKHIKDAIVIGEFDGWELTMKRTAKTATSEE